MPSIIVKCYQFANITHFVTNQLHITASIRSNEPGLVEPSPVTGEVASPASVTLTAEATPAGVREQQARYTSSAKQQRVSSGSSGSFGGSSSYGGSSSQSSFGGSSSQSSYGGGSGSPSSSPYERIQQQKLPIRSGTKY